MVLSPSKLLFVALFSATVFTNVHAETATFTFAIKFDLWPSENSFSVTSLADGEVVASSPTFEYEVWSLKLYTQTMELVLGGQYLLTVKDSAQNGLTEPSGEYGIFYGAQLTDASQTIVHEMHFDDDQDEREVISLNSFDQYDDLALLQSFLIGFFLFNARGEAVYQPSTIFCESEFFGAF